MVGDSFIELLQYLKLYLHGFLVYQFLSFLTFITNLAGLHL